MNKRRRETVSIEVERFALRRRGGDEGLNGAEHSIDGLGEIGYRDERIGALIQISATITAPDMALPPRKPARKET
jgi:hypothetical protein